MNKLVKQEIRLHDDLIAQANGLITDKPFINTVRAKDYLDASAEYAIVGNSARAYTFAVIGAHIYQNRGTR